MLEKVPETLGRALAGVRAGIDLTLYERAARLAATLSLTSSAFGEGAPLDARFTEDADSPTPKPIVHLILLLAAADGAIAEGALSAGAIPSGRNSFGKTGWLPPDPPTGHGDHRYCFQLFALAAPVTADAPGRAAVAEAVKAHGIARGRLIATYRRG